MRTTQKLSVLILLSLVCLIGNVNAQQRKNFIISQCTVKKVNSTLGDGFTDSEKGYANELTDLFIGENVQVVRLEPNLTIYNPNASQLPNYKFDMLGFTFTLQYFPLGAKYVKYQSSEFLLTNMNWNKTETQRFKSEFSLNVKEYHEELGPIIITLMAVLDTGY